MLAGARDILATELTPTFEVHTSCEVMPDLRVDGHALLRTIRQLCQAIANAAGNQGDGSGRSRLFTLRSGPDVCLAY